jgi:hypothetical protein
LYRPIYHTRFRTVALFVSTISARSYRTVSTFLLAAFRDGDDVTDYSKLHEVFHEVWAVDKEAPEKGCDGYPKQISEYQSRSMRALVAEVPGEKPDLLQIEYTNLAPLRPIRSPSTVLEKKGASGRVPFIAIGAGRVLALRILRAWQSLAP